MKTISKKLLALCCAAALVLGLQVASFAADLGYSVVVSSSQVQLVQNGKVANTYQIKSSDITITATKDYPLILSFKDSASKKKNISLGDQTSLTISGTLSSLTLDKALSSSFTLNIGAKASVSAMTVHSGGKVVIADDAKVSKISSSNKNASIKTASGKTVTSSTAKAPTATVQPSKPASSSPSTSVPTTDIRLTIKALSCSKGDTLFDLEEDLNDNVTARDASGDFVDGECKWNYSTSREINDDSVMPFTFYPAMEAYPPVKGSVKIYADGNSEDIKISYTDYTESNPLLVGDGDRLSDFTTEVKDSIYVENDNGDSVPYTFKWNTTTKFTGTERLRAYRFTITPKNSRYLKQEGVIYIKGESAE